MKRKQLRIFPKLHFLSLYKAHCVLLILYSLTANKYGRLHVEKLLQQILALMMIGIRKAIKANWIESPTACGLL